MRKSVYIGLRLAPSEKAALEKLVEVRQATQSEVLRSLVRDAAESIEAGEVKSVQQQAEES